ncbi:pectate lyase superfamily protein-domain-containing protein [Immersiella caudata]|uniref:Pectate lyase superfamily protein-domain-containing protein n=1 Tax=Immersiella caudata TaxID=314043 RepID=A0AA39WDK7_9PEZI|nr:pectate lyase superfamily protein-domain-containing protein [Immersiella caudata]
MMARHSLVHTLLLAAGVTGNLQQSAEAEIHRREACPAPAAGAPKMWWRAEVAHNGVTPYSTDSAYQYYRNMLSYGADDTGVNDSSKAFNDAVHAWQRAGNTVSTRPAYIYVPPGTYLIKEPIQLLVYTFLVGDAVNIPTLIADSSLNTEPVIHGYDLYQGENGATKNFYMAVRNFRINTSRISRHVQARGMEWSVSQSCSLVNVHVTMPVGSAHVGISMSYGGSASLMSDSILTGGAIGLQIASQQYLVKNLTFTSCATGIYIKWSHVTTVQNCHFLSCTTGIDAAREGSAGAISVIDSIFDQAGVGVLVYAPSSGSTQSSVSLVMDGVEFRGANLAKATDGRVLRGGSVPQGQSWVLGNTEPDGYQGGAMYVAPRARALVDRGKYFVKALPQYEEWDVGMVVNVKEDPEFRVWGDNLHNDGPSINAILRKHAGCKLIFLPQGVYQTLETIYVPPGSRLVGEVFSTITALGDHFTNPASPQPIVQVGRPGESGAAQLSDILISVGDVLPGAILLQINMALPSPGSVSLFNVVLRVGGSADTPINTKCSSPSTPPSTCKAAFALLHLAPSSSAYLEGIWGWVADHGLDTFLDPSTPPQNIAVGRGALIQSTSPVWMLGTSFEHCVLYQYSLHNASNVYMALQQTESPYWQGAGTLSSAPSPWVPNAAHGDPTFEHCLPDDAHCRRAWAMSISHSDNITVHGSALWTFFNGMRDGLLADANCMATGGICQTSLVGISDAASTYLYGLATRAVENMVWDAGNGGGNGTVVKQDGKKGGWGGVVVAYLRDVEARREEEEEEGKDRGDGDDGGEMDDENGGEGEGGEEDVKENGGGRERVRTGWGLLVGGLVMGVVDLL